MTRFQGLVAAAVLCSLVTPVAATPAPQVTDPVGDANGGSYWSRPDTPTPVGNQSYADVTSILFETTKSVRKVQSRKVAVVTGFTITLRLAQPPVSPVGTVAAYRVLASGPGCLFGVDYYTAAPSGQPQSAIQEWCVPSGIRRVALANPTVSGSSITWTVPLSAVPKNTKVTVGSTLTEIHFETLVRGPACAGEDATPGGEQMPCALVLDGTFKRTGKFTIR